MREFARPTNLREVVARFVATRQECRVPVGGARQEGRMVGPAFRYNADMNMKGFLSVLLILVQGVVLAGERVIFDAQGAHVDPAGHSLEVTSKCLRLDGKPIVPGAFVKVEVQAA